MPAFANLSIDVKVYRERPPPDLPGMLPQITMQHLFPEINQNHSPQFAEDVTKEPASHWNEG